MLYDRIKWHYDEAVHWTDEDAARSFIPAATTTLLAASGFRYDLTDHAEFQRPDPQWTPPPGLRGMVVRCTDGTYREPSFATDFRLMDGLLRAGELDYCMWYVLPNPNVSNQQMLDAIAGQLRDSGVTWGHPGHGISIDDEPTPYHGQLTGQRMIDLRNALADTYGREELHYVGLYNGNYGFITNQGWQLWAPWPSPNGALPSWTTNLVMQQWGVAAAGEVSGFPTRPVDVDHIWDVATLDKLTGRTGSEEDDLTPEQAAQLDRIEAQLKASDMGALPLIRDNYNALHNSDMSALSLLRPIYNSTAGGTLPAIQQSVDALHAPTVDVDALAKALAPLLSSGADAHAVALEVVDVLGERLVTGGTPGGAS